MTSFRPLNGQQRPLILSQSAVRSHGPYEDPAAQREKLEHIQSINRSFQTHGMNTAALAAMARGRDATNPRLFTARPSLGLSPLPALTRIESIPDYLSEQVYFTSPMAHNALGRIVFHRKGGRLCDDGATVGTYIELRNVGLLHLFEEICSSAGWMVDWALMKDLEVTLKKEEKAAIVAQMKALKGETNKVTAPAVTKQTNTSTNTTIKKTASKIINAAGSGVMKPKAKSTKSKVSGVGGITKSRAAATKTTNKKTPSTPSYRHISVELSRASSPEPTGPEADKGTNTTVTHSDGMATAKVNVHRGPKGTTISTAGSRRVTLKVPNLKDIMALHKSRDLPAPLDRSVLTRPVPEVELSKSATG